MKILPTDIQAPSELLPFTPSNEQQSSGWAEWKHVAEAHQIPYETYYERVHVLGHDPERAATQPLEKRPKGIFIDGAWDYKTGHCKRIGVSYNTVKWKMKKDSLSFEEAFLFYRDHMVN